MPAYPNHSVEQIIEVVAQSDTDEELVAAITGHRIVIVQLAVMCGDTGTTLLFESGDSTAISPAFDFANNGVLVLPYSPAGWFLPTQRGEALTVTTGAGSSMAISLGYVID